MAINATIQVRRGLLKDFDPTKMLPGEWAVSIDASTSNQIVWMCFAPGVCKRMGTYEDFKSMISQANGEIIEELRGEFEAILADVESVAKDVSADKEEVLVVKSEILDTYIPQIQNYVNTASTHAKNAKSSETNAKTSENNAKVSETNAEEFAEEAKTYAEQALSTTPDGYNQMLSDVDLLKNSIIQTTDRTLYGSKAGGIKLIGIGGASEQGENPSPDNQQEIESVGDLKNLLEVTATSQTVNGVEFVVNEDKTITANGTATANTYVSIGTFEAVKDGKYILSGSPSGSAYSTYYLYTQSSDGAWVYEYGSGTEISLSKGDKINIQIAVKSGVTANNLIFKPMLRKASVSNAEYKPYGYSLGIKAERKNLWNNGDQSFTRNSQILLEKELPIGTYTFSAYVESTDTGHKGCLVVFNGGKESGDVYATIARNERSSVTVTLESPVKGITLYSAETYSGGEGDVSTWTNIQIEEGTVATPYEPYRSKSITIPLNEPLRGIGEVKDEIVCQDGVWGVLRRIGKYITDGTEAVNPSSALTGRWYFTNILGYVKIYGLCMTNVSIHSQNGTGLWEHFVDHAGAFFINTDCETEEEFRTFLSESSMNIIYELATPTFEPFTDQTPFYGLESFDTVTYISTDSEVEPSIELKFGKTEGDAVTLLNYNQTNLNRIAIAELTSAVLALNQE